MKSITKLSLADLISASTYLEEYDKKLDDFLVRAHRINEQKKEKIITDDLISETTKRLATIRVNQIALKKEISERLFTKLERESDAIIEDTIKKESLKEFVGKRAEAYGLKLYQTVPIRVIDIILHEAQKEGLTNTNSHDAIRKTLQRLGYSKERVPKQKKKSNYPFPKYQAGKFLPHKIEDVLTEPKSIRKTKNRKTKT